jgi:MoxR-like ATPase
MSNEIMKCETIARTPIKGEKVLLRGFEPAGEGEARDVLTREGYQVVTSIALADALVVGPGHAATAIEAAQKSNILVVQWIDFHARLSNSPPPPTPDAASRQAAVEVGSDFVRILDQVLPRSGVKSPLVPAAEQFRHLCLDGGFLQNARAVALGVRQGMPVALEGETAASKTTAIQWVAHLIGHPVVRLNLHGQSDTGELMGRYVPSDGRDDEDRRGKMERSLAAVNHGGVDRGLPAFDEPVGWNKCEHFVAEERAPRPSWRFQEGYVPKAARHGWWLLLDEMNLAEAQVLERLNSVIEQPASLVLTEHDGTIFGAGGTVPIAPGFHMFATMNPAEYAGRTVLSPAFRDRWLIWHQAASPGEAEFAAMLRCLIFGEQPEVVFRGKLYQAPSSKPAYPELAGIPGMREAIPRLALFHSSLCQAAGMGGTAPALGRLRRERYVFTRRTLLSCLRLLHHARISDPGEPFGRHLREAIEAAYLGRIHEGADRNAATTLLRAAGLAEL